MIKNKLRTIIAAFCLLCIFPTYIQSADQPVAAKTVVTPIVKAAPGIIGPNESLPGDLCIFTANVENGSKPVWAIMPKEAASRLYVDSNGFTAVFSSRDKGTYYLAMAVSIGDTTSIYTHELVNNDGPNPNPGPDPEPTPTPDPTPVPGKKFVVVTLESDNRETTYAASLMGLRAYLEEKGYPYRFVDPNFTDGSNKKPEWYTTYESKITASKLDLPVIVVGDANIDKGEVTNIIVKPFPTTSAAAIKIIKDRGGE